MRQNTFGSWVKWCAVVASFCVALAACGSKSTSGDPCGEGEHVRALGRGYCVYQGGIVIEGGFGCPTDLPFRIDVDDGVVCAEDREGIEELPDAVCTKFTAGCRAPSDPMRDAGLRDGGDPDARFDAGPPPDSGSSDGGSGGPLPDGATCAADTDCLSGLCYGTADMMGAFSEATCQSACLPESDRAHYCNSDADCCAGTSCCIGCGEREGLCLRDAPGDLMEGDTCGDGVPGVCGAGLSCCYPCGIPGCTNVCEPTCVEGTPGCAGGCMLRP